MRKRNLLTVISAGLTGAGLVGILMFSLKSCSSLVDATKYLVSDNRPEAQRCLEKREVYNKGAILSFATTCIGLGLYPLIRRDSESSAPSAQNY